MDWLAGVLRRKRAPATVPGASPATVPVPHNPNSPEPAARLSSEATASGTDIHFLDLVGSSGAVRAVGVSVLLARVEPLVQRLYHEIGWRRDAFDAQIRPVVERYAAYVHLLPASESHHHSRFGGLLVHGLEVAIESARLCRESVLDLGRVFQRDIEMRASRKRLWPVAAAFGGLLHDLGKVLVDILVSRADTGEVWNPYTGPVTDWIAREGIHEITVSWRPGRVYKQHEPFGIVLAWPIIGQDMIVEFNAYGRDIFEGMLMGAVEDIQDPTGLGPMVKSADGASVRRDREAQRLRWREGAVGGHPVVNRLLEAFHGLLEDETWIPNTIGRPLWVTPEGVFLQWSMAVAHARGWLREKSSSGSIPDDEDVLANYLVDSHLARPRMLADGTRETIWMVRLPSAGGFTSNDPVQMLLIADPNVLFSGRSVPPPVVMEIMPDRTALAMEVEIVDVAEEGVAAATSITPPSYPPVDQVAASLPRQRPTPAEACTPCPHAPTPAPSRDSSLPSAEDAQVYFESIGMIGEVLITLLKDYAQDPDRFANLLCYRERKLLLRWPDSIAAYATSASDVVKCLNGNRQLLASTFRNATIDATRGSLVIKAEVNPGDEKWPVIVFSEDVSRYAFAYGDPRPARDHQLRVQFCEWLMAEKDLAALVERSVRVIVNRFVKATQRKGTLVVNALQVEPSMILGADGPEVDQRLDMGVVSALIADVKKAS